MTHAGRTRDARVSDESRRAGELVPARTSSDRSLSSKPIAPDRATAPIIDVGGWRVDAGRRPRGAGLHATSRVLDVAPSAIAAAKARLGTAGGERALAALPTSRRSNCRRSATTSGTTARCSISSPMTSDRTAYVRQVLRAVRPRRLRGRRHVRAGRAGLMQRPAGRCATTPTTCTTSSAPRSG